MSSQCQRSFCATSLQISESAGKDLSQRYESFIESSARHFFHLQPLHRFVSWASKIEARIWLVIFGENTKPKVILLREYSTDPQQDLATWLGRDKERHLYIVEDISPQTMKLFGGYLDIDPQFFADYLHMALPDNFSNPSTIARPEGDYRSIEPVPFFRWGDIAYHLPALQSIRDKSAYVSVQYIGPRECRAAGTESKNAALEDRMHADSSRTNVERIAGAHNPVQLEDRRAWPVAMSRHSVAAWFDEGVPETPGDWLKGIILLDRPFESAQISLPMETSRYRPFVNLPSTWNWPPNVTSVDLRQTYATSLLHCFEFNEQLRQNIPTPVAILQDVYRIVASEWIAVTAYMERDLNYIEWKLEQKEKTPTLEVLEKTLKALFIMRRRNRKYKTMVRTQLLPRWPRRWEIDNSDGTSDNPRGMNPSTRSSIQSDYQQVDDLVLSNESRILQMIELVTSIMSVLEAKKSNMQNRRLTFLAILASVALPFNSLAAILAMQTDYAPGRTKWNVFWGIASTMAAAIIVAYLGVVYFDRARLRAILSFLSRKVPS